LEINDIKVLIVAMEGIEKILLAGKMNFMSSEGENLFALELEMCGGVD